MIVKIKLDEGARQPRLAHSLDAGYDLFAREGVHVRGWNSVIIDTGVHIQIPEDCMGEILSKSGLNTKHNLTTTGVVDPGYTGSIKVKLYNNSCFGYDIQPGDKIAQLVFVKIERPTLMLTDILEESERGEKGFGSSGR